MSLHRPLVLLSLLVSLALPALRAEAMTVLAVDLSGLVQTSELVLHGTVVAVENRDRRAEGKGVWTAFTLEVAAVWKGEAAFKVSPARAGKRLTWAHPGGTRTDGLVVSVPGMPTFAVGEEVVVALEKTAHGYVICGGPQGKWSVRTDKAGKKTVTREMPDVQFLAPSAASGTLGPAPTPPQAARTLAEFKADVEKAQKSPAQTPAPIPVQRLK